MKVLAEGSALEVQVKVQSSDIIIRRGVRPMVCVVRSLHFHGAVGFRAVGEDGDEDGLAGGEGVELAVGGDVGHRAVPQPAALVAWQGLAHVAACVMDEPAAGVAVRQCHRVAHLEAQGLQRERAAGTGTEAQQADGGPVAIDGHIVEALLARGVPLTGCFTGMEG